jgi:Domain of unknown function (DUF397)
MEDQIGAGWRKSSYSGNGGSDCVEIGQARSGVAVRDTKDRTGLTLGFTADTWRRFIDDVKNAC